MVAASSLGAFGANHSALSASQAAALQHRWSLAHIAAAVVKEHGEAASQFVANGKAVAALENDEIGREYWAALGAAVSALMKGEK